MKSSRIITCTFGFEVVSSGRALREMIIREEIEGCESAWWRTSFPMKPVEPVRMSFILRDIEFGDFDVKRYTLGKGGGEMNKAIWKWKESLPGNVGGEGYTGAHEMI